MDGGSNNYDFMIDGEQSLEWLTAMQLGVNTLNEK